ncbi:MAG: DUF1598 domain-containing protein [Planctomycetaceae bacterium]
MSRRDPKNTRITRRHSGARTPLWVATVCFALVVGTLAVMARTTPSRSAPATAAARILETVDRPEPPTAVATATAPRRPLQTAAENVAAAAPLTSGPTLAGGAEADFESLIDLIQKETSGPWEDADGSGGSISDTDQMAGIHVDPSGLLTRLVRTDRTGRLDVLSNAATTASENADINRLSRLRLVSLTRLEQEVARRVASGEPLPADIRNLAGLTQVRFVFVYSGDIVIGGPAEGYTTNLAGNTIGGTSGHPVLQLDDLVTVLRTFNPEGDGVIGCSIDPRPEGLQRLKNFVASSNSRGELTPGKVKPWTDQLKNALGRQDITITGVPADSRVARVLVEADYKMKLIGIGQLDAGRQLPGIFDLLTAEEQKDSSLDALRWWLTMKYRQVLHSAAGDAFQLVGSAVLCRSENEFVNARGQRVQTGKSEGSNRRFAENFTKHYPELSRRDTVFADLKNIFDLALVAALVNRQGLAEQADWDPGVFGPHGDYQTTAYPVPRTVDSVVNHRVFRGRDVVVQVAGGVRADIGGLLKNRQVIRANSQLNGIAPAARPEDLAGDRWWWDLPIK